MKGLSDDEIKKNEEKQFSMGSWLSKIKKMEK